MWHETIWGHILYVVIHKALTLEEIFCVNNNNNNKKLQKRSLYIPINYHVP